MGQEAKARDLSEGLGESYRSYFHLFSWGRLVESESPATDECPMHRSLVRIIVVERRLLVHAEEEFDDGPKELGVLE